MSFILRVVHNDNFPEKKNPNPIPIGNNMLGKNYQVVLKSIHKTDFESLSQDFYTPEGIELFGLVVRQDGQALGLWDDSTHYIMTENGTTFEKIHNPEGTKQS